MGGLFLTTSELNINQGRHRRQTLFLGSMEQLIGKDRYLYGVQAAGAGPACRRMAASTTNTCPVYKLCPVAADTAELSQTPDVSPPQ